MLNALATIVKDNWACLSKIGGLSLFDLTKKSRGAVLGWGWFFIKPAMYIFCFWFALSVGLRSATVSGDAPYILWLSAGLIPWFFMQDMLGAGTDVYHRYPYLVTRIKFPLAVIPSIYSGACMIVECMLMAVLLCMYFLCGQPLDIHLIQIPVLLALMLLFWTMNSLFFSLLSAMSKDFKNLIAALSTPIFWLSGVIFAVKNIQIGWIQLLLCFNPVTFFVEAFRATVYDLAWFWEDPQQLLGFACVFVLTLFMTAFMYKRLSKEVPDVL